MSVAVELSSAQRELLLALLRRYIPDVEVWAYGSRVKWIARPNSDLDLIAFTAPKQRGNVADLKDAFAESDLPFLIDLHVWDDVPERFHETIRKEHVVLQGASGDCDDTRSEWPIVPLGDVVNLKRGYDLAARERQPGSVPIISSSGCSGFHSKAMVQPPGVVTGRYGTIGEVHFVEVPFWPLNTTLYVQDFKGNDPRFVYYLLKTIRYTDYLDKAAVPGINRNDVHRALVSLPPINEQKIIANIMTCLDRSIEALQSSNETLESIAKAIFKSWFVDFDPVRAKAEGREPEGMDAATAALFPDAFEDSSPRPLPRCWRSGSLDECVSFENSSRVPLSSAERSKRKGPFPYYGAAGPIDSVDDFLFDGEYVLVGEDGSVIDPKGKPVIQHVWGRFWVSNHAHVLKPKNGWSVEAILNLLGAVEIVPFVTGAVQPKLSMTNLRRVPVVIPTPGILDSYSRQTDILLSRKRLNAEHIATLVAIRDTLLPRLISGKLRVPEPQKLVEAVL